MATSDAPPAADPSSDDSKYIGVTDSYTIRKQTASYKGGSSLSYDDVTQTPDQYGAYVKGDEYGLLTGLDGPSVAEIQQKMMAAGLLTGKFQLGRADDKTVAAYKKVLSYANQQGKDADTSLQELSTADTFDPSEVGKQPLAVETPDINELKSIANQVAQQTLGRNLDPQMQQHFADAYVAAAQQTQQANIQAQVTALANGQQTYATQAIPDQKTFIDNQIRQANPQEAAAHDFSGQADQFSQMLQASQSRVVRS